MVTLMQIAYETIAITKFRGKIVWRLKINENIDIDSYREYLLRLKSNGYTKILRGSFYRSKRQFIIIDPGIDPQKMKKGVLEILAEF